MSAAIDMLSLRADGQTEAELVWVFNDAAGEMGLSSNFMPMVARLQCPRDAATVTSYDADWRQVEAASRDKVIRRALELAGSGNEAVLCAAYTEPAPKGLEPLGRLAGVVLRLPATQEAHVASKSARELPDWLAHLVKPSASARRRAEATGLRTEAELLLYRAVQAYRIGRGKARRG